MSGLMPIFWKELADYLYSKRFMILFLLIYAAGIYSIYVAAQYMQSSLTADTSQFVFLRLYILTPDSSSFSLIFRFSYRY